MKLGKKTLSNTIKVWYDENVHDNVWVFKIFLFYFRYPGGDCTSDIYLADMDAKVAKL